MRIPLTPSMESRDGNRSRDAQVINALVEIQGDQTKIRKRPGVTDQGLVKSGSAQLLYYWNGLKAVIGDFMNAGSVSTIVSGPVQTNLSPTNAGLLFSAQDTVAGAATPRLFFKNRTQGWVVNRAGTIGAVTYASTMGAGTYNLISLTRTGGTATATLAEDVFNAGDVVTIAGATPIAYNGAQTIMAVTLGVAARTLALTITRSGTTATARTADGSAHGLTSGVSYTISGAAQSEYNGTFVITSTSSTSFTYTVTVTSYSALTGTWNPADKDSGVTLSGGNLSTSISAPTSTSNARGTVGKSSGKWYWEITCTLGGNNGLVGVANATASLTSALGQDANSWAYSGNGGIVAGGVTTSAPTWTTGDVIGVQLNMDAGTVSFFKNGTAVGTFSGLTGTIYAAIGQTAAFTFNATANFAGTFTYSVDGPASPATGSPTLSVAAANPTFSFTIGGSPATPATGTITAQGSGGTVPGIAYLNGTFYVMDVNGVIWGSTAAGDDPTTWPALNFATAQMENGAGKAITKSQNYVIAFKEYSTELWYDAKQPSGLPLLPVENGFTKIGCANGFSLAEVAGRLFFISQTRGKGRSVHMQLGMQQQKVSTPEIDRILDNDGCANVYAFGLAIDGHNLYVLNLASLTIVYDVDAQHWGRWASYTLGSTVNVSSITRSGSVATVACATAHNQVDGAPVLIAGAGQGEYNGYFPAQSCLDTVFNGSASKALRRRPRPGPSRRPAIPGVPWPSRTRPASTARPTCCTAPTGTSTRCPRRAMTMPGCRSTSTSSPPGWTAASPSARRWRASGSSGTR
jgi:hypothetical protein